MVLQTHKPKKAYRSFKLNQKIYITRLFLLTSNIRAENPDLFYLKMVFQIVFAVCYYISYLLNRLRGVILLKCLRQWFDVSLNLIPLIFAIPRTIM